MSGKNKCKILKEIRQKIADENDIAYVTSECKHQGECSGTCPKCEAEVRYLENELKKRQNAGKAVAVAGIAAALVVSSSGCLRNMPWNNDPPAGDVPYYEETEQAETAELLIGEVPYTEAEPLETAEVLAGDIAYVEEPTETE